MERRILKISQTLNRKSRISVRKGRPFETLIGCILSQRTRDETTWPAADRLFKVAGTPEKMLQLPAKRIAKIIYPVGFYNQKSKTIRKACRMLLREYSGRVPKTKAELMKLPGI